LTFIIAAGWGLVSHLIIGGHKARRYAELANGDFIWCHVQCSWSQLLGQPLHICPILDQIATRGSQQTAHAVAFAISAVLLYTIGGSGCRLVAVPAFKAVRGAIALSPVGSIPTPSATYCNLLRYGLLPIIAQNSAEGFRPVEWRGIFFQSGEK